MCLLTTSNLSNGSGICGNLTMACLCKQDIHNCSNPEHLLFMFHCRFSEKITNWKKNVSSLSLHTDQHKFNPLSIFDKAKPEKKQPNSPTASAQVTEDLLIICDTVGPC